MRWGDTQSLLTVIIGLNLGYYAFREMRAPHVDRLRENLDKVDFQLQSSREEVRLLRESTPLAGRREDTKTLTSLFFELMKLQQLVTTLRLRANRTIRDTSSIAVERRLGLPAMLVAIAAIVLLIVSTVRYDAAVSRLILYATIIVGFLPIIGAIAINYVVLRKISTHEKELEDIGIRLIKAVSDLGTYKIEKLTSETDRDPADAVSGEPQNS